MAEQERIGGPDKFPAERDLVRLVFVSVAAPDLSPTELEAIEKVSADRNLAAGLSGLLLHQSGGFFSVLEGPRRRLFSRMERIITDQRHARVEILFETTPTVRRFDNWSFTSLPVSDAVVRPTVAEDFIRRLGRRLA